MVYAIDIKTKYKEQKMKFLVMAYNLERSYKSNVYEFLQEREVEVLVYYMLYGYNEDTKRLIEKTYNWRNTTRRQYDYKLTRKGCLVKTSVKGKKNKKDAQKFRKFSDDLENILQVAKQESSVVLFQING